jgi:hypothetical protein
MWSHFFSLDQLTKWPPCRSTGSSRRVGPGSVILITATELGCCQVNCWHPRRPKSAAIPKPHDLSFCFNHRCIPRLKNHVLSYTKSTDFRDLSEARFRVSHGTVLTKRFLYLLRATFYPDKLFWTEPPKPSFQGAVRPLGFRDGLFNSNVKPT